MNGRKCYSHYHKRKFNLTVFIINTTIHRAINFLQDTPGEGRFTAAFSIMHSKHKIEWRTYIEVDIIRFAFYVWLFFPLPTHYAFSLLCVFPLLLLVMLDNLIVILLKYLSKYRKKIYHFWMDENPIFLLLQIISYISLCKIT